MSGCQRPMILDLAIKIQYNCSILNVYRKEQKKVKEDNDMRKQTIVTLSFTTKEQKEKYMQAAKEHGVSFSSLMRLALERYCRQEGWL